MKRLTHLILLVLGSLMLLAVLQGCAAVGVNVWQRDVLSKPQMQLDGDAERRAMDDHVYFSKEASSGGRGFGGGGCGCN
ncbi:MAG TPA: DUF4266 domain-containing protein [Candidatus Acidoferrum sp.]|nr:DUF4266 domain-containing protein [Candidatus Acidoferrum sp.]